MPAAVARAQALTQLTLQAPAADQLLLEDLWAVTINTAAAGGAVYLRTTVAREGQTVLTRCSAPFPLISGISRPDARRLQVVQSDFRDAGVQNACNLRGAFPGGTWEVCTQLVRAEDQYLLDEACATHRVADAPPPADSTGRGFVRFAGQGYVEAGHQHLAYADHELPRRYVRTEWHPTLQLGPVPLRADVFYSTEQRDDRQALNAATFGFDAVQFREQLKQELLTRWRARATEEHAALYRDQAKLRELERLEKVLQDPATVAEGDYLDSLGRLPDSTARWAEA
ncbi:MAG: hypothetical protein WBA12_00995, partial [Catalinimonas sp.]